MPKKKMKPACLMQAWPVPNQPVDLKNINA